MHSNYLGLEDYAKIQTCANGKKIQKDFYGCNDLNLYISANHKFSNNNNNILTFYKDIHNLFMKNLTKEPNTAEAIIEQSAWHNNHININKKCIHWRFRKKKQVYYK